MLAAWQQSVPLPHLYMPAKSASGTAVTACGDLLFGWDAPPGAGLVVCRGVGVEARHTSQYSFLPQALPSRSAVNSFCRGLRVSQSQVSVHELPPELPSRSLRSSFFPTSPEGHARSHGSSVLQQ